MKKVTILFLVLAAITANAQDEIRLDSLGIKLQHFYLSLDVEHIWIAGHHINWETGEPDKPGATDGIKTHCSAFVASACKKLNIYILRPPQHGQVLLADAQFEWLQTPEARNNGWLPVSGNDTYAIYRHAQEYANKGFAVTAIWENPSTRKPGHVALVMPKEISTNKIKESGPIIIMAGTHNFNYISLANGFKHHISQWPEKEILFYYNANKIN